MTFRISHPQNEDEGSQIAQFQVDMAYESEGAVLDFNVVTRGVMMAIKDPISKGRYFIAKTTEPTTIGSNVLPEGTMAGSLLVTREWSDWHCEWYWWIQSVYVRPNFRRMGAFRSLYNEVVKQAKTANIREIRLYVDKDNTRSQAIYKHLGMQDSHYQLYTCEL